MRSLETKCFELKSSLLTLKIVWQKLLSTRCTCCKICHGHVKDWCWLFSLRWFCYVIITWTKYESSVTWYEILGEKTVRLVLGTLLIFFNIYYYCIFLYYSILLYISVYVFQCTLTHLWKKILKMDTVTGSRVTHKLKAHQCNNFSFQLSMKITSKTLKFTFSFNKPCKEQHPWEKGQINVHPPAWNCMSSGAKYKKQQDIVSLCSPSIQQCEKQMHFYWADYPRAHCPTVRDACAWAPLSTVAVRWVMFMRFSDFLSPS